MSTTGERVEAVAAQIRRRIASEGDDGAVTPTAVLEREIAFLHERLERERGEQRKVLRQMALADCEMGTELLQMSDPHGLHFQPVGTPARRQLEAQRRALAMDRRRAIAERDRAEDEIRARLLALLTQRSHVRGGDTVDGA